MIVFDTATVYHLCAQYDMYDVCVCVFVFMHTVHVYIYMYIHILLLFDLSRTDIDVRIYTCIYASMMYTYVLLMYLCHEYDI